MNVTGDSDPDSYGKPKFNSTVLGPDERPHISENGKTGQHALKLSPIPKDRVQFMNSNGSTFSEQHFHNSEECSELQDSKLKTKLEAETLSSFIGCDSKSGDADKENVEMEMLESKILSERSIFPKSNSTARSHITNPFDSDIMESLSATTYSPNLFNNSKKTGECGTPEKSFRWSIGQIADFRPATIDETESVYPTPDPAEEVQIHSAIDKFWASQKYVLPSPQFMKGSIKSEQMDSPSLILKTRTLLHESPLTLSVPKTRSIESQKSVEVQTMFTFPPNLDLIGLLGNCFQYEEGEVAVFEANLSLNTLRRKLFLNALSSQTNIMDESECSVTMDTDDDYDGREPFSHERPAWYHSNDEIISTRRVSFDDVRDPNEEAEINSRLLSPNISPIKK
ncbi:hypothetical protein X798_00838 [Onchocerca flexuosa]|uniref:Protein aurora borealis n=1 Tax=Onchocerca flexuosa TaxID=387005 RepID=A0A238C545_9BILA|nr:hypothetical protein X798_00838 [Onchocerca flexuosa]